VNKNSYKFNGLVNRKTVGVTSAIKSDKGVTLSTKRVKGQSLCLLIIITSYLPDDDAFSCETWLEPGVSFIFSPLSSLFLFHSNPFYFFPSPMALSMIVQIMRAEGFVIT